MIEYTDYEKYLINRPLFGNYVYDSQDMPVMHKVTRDMIDLDKAEPINIKSLSCKNAKSNYIAISFNKDKDLKRYWEDPLKYIPRLLMIMAACTPDYSIYPEMDINEIRRNTYKNRWLGCTWQDNGCIAFPTMSWTTPETYDICFSGVEQGGIVVISTLGVKENLPIFIAGLQEMKRRIHPEIIIVYGDMREGMTGTFINFEYEEAFNKNKHYKQQRLFNMSPVFEIKEVA